MKNIARTIISILFIGFIQLGFAQGSGCNWVSLNFDVLGTSGLLYNTTTDNRKTAYEDEMVPVVGSPGDIYKVYSYVEVYSDHGPIYYFVLNIKDLDKCPKGELAPNSVDTPYIVGYNSIISVTGQFHSTIYTIESCGTTTTSC